MHVFDILICCIDILCALIDVLKLIACRVDAYLERESIFSGCLAPVRFQSNSMFSFLLYALILEQTLVRCMSDVLQSMALTYFRAGMIPIV